VVADVQRTDAISVAISLNRPNILEFTGSLRRHLEKLEREPEAADDKRLIAWFKLQLISEDVAKTFNQKSGVAEGTLLGLVSQVEVSRLQQRFSEWQDSLDPSLMTGKK